MNNKFFEILKSGDESELREFLLKEGKEPKVICPIQFFDKELAEDNNKNKGE